jgi:flagellar biosynthesis/type III secretory pathway protein FliH
MKRFALPVIGLALCVFAGAVYHRVQGENNALKLENVLYQSENRLLKDELSEKKSARTYEEGLTDGLMRANNRGYTDGYHAAMSQVSEEKQAAEDKKAAKAGN